MTDFLPPPFLRNIQKSPIRQISDRAKPGDISLGLGEPDLPTPDVIRNAAIKVIAEEQNGYTLQAGLPALRDLVARDYPQLNLSSDQVVITAGSQEALYLALMTLIKAGDEVLIPDPGFVAYPTIIRMAGGIPVTYRMPAANNFSFDADAFRQALTERTTVVVCVSPSNPTGRTLSASDLAAIAAALKGTGIYILSDEIYRDIYYAAEPPPDSLYFLRAHDCDQWTLKIDEHDGLATGVDLWRCRRDSRRSCLAWLRDNLCLYRFAKGSVGGVDR